MELYIEYVFLENFILDGVLLALSAYSVKVKCSYWRICFSAMLGAVFAILFPLLHLPKILRACLKVSMGCLLCMPLVGKLKSRRAWERYGLVTAVFLGLSFGFGGAILGVYQGFVGGEDGFSMVRAPSYAVFLAFSVVSLGCIVLVKRLYRRKVHVDNLYACVIRHGGKRVKTDGFLDSGNTAVKNGFPVCFLSADLLYDVWGEWLFSTKVRGQVCDEMKISTITGERIISVYLGDIVVKIEEKSIKKRNGKRPRRTAGR